MLTMLKFTKVLILCNLSKKNNSQNSCKFITAKKSVGEANVEAILEDSPQKIWEQTKNESGINLEFFNKYYKGKKGNSL